MTYASASVARPILAHRCVPEGIRSAMLFGLVSHPIRPHMALQVYALTHRVLMGDDPFVLSHDGVMSMASEYAHTAQMAFARISFNMIGASFGAVLASHVVHTARAIGCRPWRVVLVDPPPAVPRELPLPRMLTRYRKSVPLVAPTVGLSFQSHLSVSNHVACAQPSDSGHGRALAQSADRDGCECVGAGAPVTCAFQSSLRPLMAMAALL
jgi:hypothetical protein